MIFRENNLTDDWPYLGKLFLIFLDRLLDRPMIEYKKTFGLDQGMDILLSVVLVMGK